MPLIDAFEDLLGTEVFNKLLEKGIIRIESIAYLRGRTLKGLVSSSRCL
jgi:phosphate starvation-inducible protein PhoH